MKAYDTDYYESVRESKVNDELLRKNVSEILTEEKEKLIEEILAKMKSENK